MQLVQINETNTRANSATTGQDANVLASEEQTPQSPSLQPVVEEKSGKYVNALTSSIGCISNHHGLPDTVIICHNHT